MTSRDPDTLSNATEEVRTCAVCRKDADDQQPCTGCMNAPAYDGGLMVTTWFCSIHCQLEFEPAHKNACRAADCRRTLYRAGRTTQLIFQCCQEALSKICIAKVEKRGDVLYVHQAKNTKKQDLPSLSSVFDSEDDKEAAIACMASNAAIPFARALLKLMLPDDILRFARVDHTVQSPPRHVIMIKPDGTEIDNTSQPHSILQITLQNLESSAIDITGVQYGYHDPVVPWDIYRHSRIQEVRGVRALPSLADDQWQIEDAEEYRFVKSLIETVEKWEGVNWPMQYVLQGGWTWQEAEYLEWRGKLVEFIDHWVKNFAAKKEEAGIAGANENH